MCSILLLRISELRHKSCKMLLELQLLCHYPHKINWVGSGWLCGFVRVDIYFLLS